MLFEDFVNTIKDINKIVSDDDIRDIVSYIGSIEKKLNKIAGKNNDKLYSLIGDAIEQMSLDYIVELSAKEDLGYRIVPAVDLFVDGSCDCDVYDCLNDRGIYLITSAKSLYGKGFVKLMEWRDLLKSEQYKYVINKLAHNYELILNDPDIPDESKEPIRKIENMFKILSVKEK